MIDSNHTKHGNKKTNEKKSTGQESSTDELVENIHKLKTKIPLKKSKSHYREKQNKGNFLYNLRYGNLPVMEFKLPDGSSGTVDKVPRR